MLLEFRTIDGNRALIDPTEIKSVVGFAKNDVRERCISVEMKERTSISLEYHEEYFDEIQAAKGK